MSKDKIKLSLFADDIIIHKPKSSYTHTFKKSSSKINKFIKVRGYQKNT